MRPDEARSWEHDNLLDVCNEQQVRAWAERYSITPAEVREVCEMVGPNRTAVELMLAAPRA